MDHLMPEMDGIQCLERIRNQEGGLNRNTPVVVLTANAGSTNKELYNRAGFDGYLVKPVSGDALESMLIKHIAGEKLVIRDTKMTGESSDINTLSGYSGKAPVVITTSSMSDLPEEIVRRINLPIIPCHILTAEGDFKDGEQMGADELIRYIGQGKEATSWPPTEAEYTEFFSSVLRRAHHVIHISLTTSMSVEYKRASEAAKSFGNVTVINSGCLSSATGILALIAYKLSQQNIPVEDIVKELETIKERLRCSFVIDTTEYMARRGLITKRLHRMAGNLSLHPAIRFRDDKSGVGFVWSGSTKRAYKKYINWAFPVDIIPDSDVVFITYVDIPHDTLMWIKEEISKVAYFEHVVFKQASAAISSNCGPGTFGILYFVKSNKSYNIGSYVADAEAAEKEAALLADTVAKEEPVLQEADRSSDGTVSSGESDTKWYHSIEGIDGETAIKNSGSEDAFKSVLQIFYDSIPAKSAEIGKYYADSDWPDYTIKVHALKSSARLIGATDLADRAQLLENAGKESDADYIRTNHDAFMQDYLAYGEYLKGVCGKEEDAAGDSGAKPVAGDEIMQGVYAGLKEAADAMDCATMEEIFDEMKDYSIPEGEKDKYEALREAAGNYDYDGILELLRNE
ncbi:MAG: DegV family EDD domain-containing protein, partial [Lachnospiraceae bacterium]|nr:DegV family EDD domain-containing protein [Lachnospiraceae bacterium]